MQDDYGNVTLVNVSGIYDEQPLFIDKLKKGTYTINEISVPFGYLIDTKSYDVEVKVNQTATKAIVNEEPTGEIKAYKTDNYNNKLKGAEISLYAREDIKNVAGTITWYKKGELITKAITNDDGMAQFSNLHLGKYYVKEIGVKSEEYDEVKINNTSYKEFNENKEQNLIQN